MESPAKSQPLLADVSGPKVPAAAPLDCLVVGAGPVGLLLASELAFRGCSVRIVDRLKEPNPHSRASVIQARSIEVLPAEVADQIVKKAHRINTVIAKQTKPGAAKAEIIVKLATEPIEGYHMLFSEKQHETERLLTEYLGSLPDWHHGGGPRMHVERGVELASFEEHSSGVEVKLKDLSVGKTETVTAKFVVACDGARSAVRRQIGVAFEGAAASEIFVAVDATLEGADFDRQALEVICGSGSDPESTGMAYSVPYEDGNNLVVLDIDPALQERFQTEGVDQDNLPLLRQPKPEEVQDLLRKRGCGAELHFKPGSVKWMGLFRMFSRQADHYGRGRIFLAGDACHCHSPLGGQGMNLGLQDAKNLAWKISMVAKGAGAPSLLETYEGERRGLETKMLQAIEAGQAAVSGRRPLANFLQGRGRPLVGFFYGIKAEALKYASQQGWSYRDSPLSVEHWERPPPTLSPITSVFPFGGYRRHQNLYRWLSTRVHAGDRVPNVKLPQGSCHGPAAPSLHQVLKRSKAWTLVLFEGRQADNEDLARHVRKTEILDLQALHSFGEALRGKPDPSGFVADVDEIVVFPAGDAAHDAFGVRGQCLMLVRPDHHVGFRCEPPRRGAVFRYFRLSCGLNHGHSEDAPASSPSFDWLPAAVWSGVAVGAVGLLATRKLGGLPLELIASWP